MRWPDPPRRRRSRCDCGRARFVPAAWRFVGLITLAALALDASPSRAAGPETPTSGAANQSSDRSSVQEGVAGVVVDAAGTPLARVLVLPAPVGGGAGPVPDMAVQTGPDGRFRWRLRPGRYRLDAVRDGRTVGSVEATVAPGRETDIRLMVRDHR